MIEDWGGAVGLKKFRTGEGVTYLGGGVLLLQWVSTPLHAMV